MAFKPTEKGMEEAVSRFLEPDEKLVTVGWASEKGVKYFYVALTDRRLLMVRLSMFYKVKGAESIPLSELELCSLSEDPGSGLLDLQSIQRMAETPLHVKAKGGKQRVFNFANILGLDNKSVPVRITEALEAGKQA